MAAKMLSARQRGSLGRLTRALTRELVLFPRPERARPRTLAGNRAGGTEGSDVGEAVLMTVEHDAWIRHCGVSA